MEMPMKKMMTLRRRPINSSMFQYESKNYMHGDFGRLVLRLTYLFCNLVDLRIDFVEPVKRETPANQENGGKTGRHRSGRRAVQVLQRMLAQNLSTNVGLSFGQEFRSPQDYGKRPNPKNSNTPCLHIRRKCYGQNSRICSHQWRPKALVEKPGVLSRGQWSRLRGTGWETGAFGLSQPVPKARFLVVCSL